MMESARELKPCPFCGGPAERVNIDSTDEHEPNCGGSYIFCPSCLTSSKVVFGEKIGLEEAWNMRTTHDRVLEACETEIRKECADKIIAWLFPDYADIYHDPDFEKQKEVSSKEIRALIMGEEK